MYNRNQINLIGNIGGAPNTGTAASGTPYATFSLATDERWKNTAGEPQEHTEWHTVVCWGKLAEITSKYLTKGSYVTVEGTLCSHEYTSDDGLKRRVWEVRANRICFLQRLEQVGGNDEPKSDGVSEGARAEIPF